MIVISKVIPIVTRQYRLPLRSSVFTKNHRAYSIPATKSIVRSINILTKRNQLVIQISKIKLHQVNSQAQGMGGLSPLDPSSFSRPELAVIKHVDLLLNVDFEQKVLNGVANLHVEVLQSIEELILDSSEITIESIELDDVQLKYRLDETVPNYGSKLSIILPEPAIPNQKCNISKQTTKDDCDVKSACTSMVFNGYMYKPSIKSLLPSNESNCSRSSKESPTSFVESSSCVSCEYAIKPNILNIKIKYKTSPSATALQWLEPQQTSGKKYPYLFSQCQPIHARSILPCQDSPAVKFTYTASVRAPPPFTVLMSAIRGPRDNYTTSFDQPVPVPSYLLAIAVAVLDSRKLGPRSNVWSESAEIEKSAWEFAETERYLQAAERLCGPYQWTQYDLLVLPPSFPYGGMENPCLTFVTPTLLAGDRSQADVIVHEIMHSWTGNLVTNRNFEHFWLNEGFTVFLERKVASSLIENVDEAKKSRDFHSILGLQELNETICSNLGENNPLTQLVPDLNSTHPDDSFSRVPYEKGSLFLRYLEDLVGGPEVFDDFMRSYLNEFQRKSLDTEQFKEYLLTYFKDNENLSKVEWSTWLHKSGMPPVIPNYDTSMTKAVTSLLSKIINGEELDYEDVKAFTPHQMINFLQGLLEQDALPVTTLRTLGEVYKVSNSKNSEIVYRWLRLCIKSRDEDKLEEVFDFVNRQGRMKYVRPIYRDLYAWEAVRSRTLSNFYANESSMMHVSAYTLRKDLHLDTNKST